MATFQSSTSNRTGLYFVRELDFGVTPTSPTLVALRYTGEALNSNVTTAKSTEIVDNRNVPDLIRTGFDASGDVKVEMSFASFDELIEGALASVWGTQTNGLSTMKNGTTLHSYTIQKKFGDMIPVEYHNARGARVGAFSLEVNTGSIVTGSFSFMALDMQPASAQFAGATIAPSPGQSNGIMSAVADVQELMIDGVAGTAAVSKMSLNISNNVRAQDAIGTEGHIGIAFGGCDVTGSLEIYFNNGALMQKYRSGTPFSLSFKLADAAGNYYRFTMPRVKFESASAVAGGENQDVMMTSGFRAVLDPTIGAMIQIDRFQV